MLKNFLEHTRFPDSLLNACLGVATSGAPPKAPTSDAVTKAISNTVQWLGDLQKNNGVPPYTKLAEVDEAIDVLRFEKYLNNSISQKDQTGPKSLVRKCYYWLRPLFPVSFRKYLQRAALRGWESNEFPVWPVDLTTEKLMEGIWRQLLRSHPGEELPFVWFWPEGKSGACIMTHDVETSVGRDFTATMMEIERRHQIYSAFEVVPEVRYEVPAAYLQDIRDNGCEVCLHGLNHDGHLFTSEAIFSERAKKINAYAEGWNAVGFRSPVMYRNLAWLPELRFLYDMSVPNVAHLDPQHGGCCTVMPYFIGDLVELPLTTTQDYSLFHILQQPVLDLWKKQIDLILDRNGLISFIIHPDYVTEKWATDLYDSLLGYLAGLRSERNVWIGLPREVAEWWKARRAMRLVQENGAWTIEGPQASRARIAYVSLKEDRITYRIENAPAGADPRGLAGVCEPSRKG
jgi:hypothetical protein